MRNLLSKREYENELPRLRLNAVWYVEADESYSVFKRNQKSDDYAAVRTIAGAGRMKLHSGETFRLEADSLGIFAMEQIAHYFSEKEGWQFYWFEFSAGSFQPSLCNQTANLPMSPQERIELEKCFQNLNRNADNECMIAESLFGYLLADWQIRAADTKRNIPLRDILALLEKGRREKISISALAREAGMCERSFRNLVHEATGVSPKAYMLRGEMAAAMELLRTTGMAVSEIAALFNYSSPFYFSRVFRRYYGISPTQARKETER